MSLEVSIDKLYLTRKIRQGSEDYKEVLNIQKKDLENVLAYRQGSEKTIELASKASMFFIGNYHTFKEKLNTIDFYRNEETNIKRNYALAMASEATIQFIEKNSEGSNATLNIGGDPQWDFRHEYNSILSMSSQLVKQIEVTLNQEEAQSSMLGYFYKLKKKSLKNIESKDLSNFLEKTKDIIIRNSVYEIKGLEDSIKQEEERPKDIRIGGRHENKDEKLSPYNLEKIVEKDHIQGNDEPKEAVEDATLSLMCYKKDVQKNPFMEDGGFLQKILLLGDSGCGKSMLADYAVSLANQVSSQYNIPFEAIEFDFKDRFQYGPAIKIEEQFRKITQANKTHIIVMNEFDGLLPSRDKTNADYAQEVVSEFLQMFDNKYQNKGNYILIATSNKPNRIDKAIKSRFKRGIFYCPGPVTAEQKSKVLENNLGIGIAAGYVKIDDWEEIGRVANELQLQGRDLAETADALICLSKKTKDKRKRYEGYFKGDYEDVLNQIKRNHNIINDSALIASLYAIKEKDNEMQKAHRSYHGDQ